MHALLKCLGRLLSFHGVYNVSGSQGRERVICNMVISSRTPLLAVFSTAIIEPFTPLTSIATLYNPAFPLPFFNSSKIGDSRLSGFVVLAHLPLTFPSLPTSHFSKFHFTRFRPMRPGASDLSHSKTGSAALPLTSVLPRMGKETP